MPFFIEVGSCDFDTCEKLIQNGWDGIVIEPVKYYYDKLTKYSNIVYENVAISNTVGESEIHYIDPKEIISYGQHWLKGISSLEGKTGPLSFPGNRKIDHFSNCLKQKVNTTTLDNICEKHNIESIDFLKVDTEGHDLIVLKSLDLKNIPVRMIKVEHKHLNSKEIIEYLERFNYLCYLEEDDIYAIK
tara:strand:- start:5581 stop:6144 length:564 start_codon:yes stop_codon:yes gene_type:complete